MKNNAIVTATKAKPQVPSLMTTILLMIPLVLPLGLALDLYLPSVPSMASALATDSLHIQLTLTLFMYCFGVGQLFVGPITDRIGRKVVLIYSLIFFTLGSIFCTIAESLLPLLLGRILQAFGACGSQVVAFAMVRDQFEGKNATIIYTSLKGAMAIAPIGAPVLGAFLQVYYGWQANFAVLALYGFLILLLSIFQLRETQSAPPAKAYHFSEYINPYKKILKHSQFLYFGFCGLATQAAMFGYFSLSPRYFISLFQLSEPEFAKLFSANAIVFLLTSLIVGKWIYKLGHARTTLIGGILLIMSACFMMIGNHYFEHPYVLFLPNLIASSSAAMMLGAAASGAMQPFKENAGSAAAMFGCMEFLGGASIGQMAIWSQTISVLPLAFILLLLGMMIGIFNFMLRRQI
ncbi:MAG: multidrug effflux MFS transporter [Gammaproteobacteria bacterium]|jgi:Bcr/CflA subfamily drug resistance transporter|nr:multidrug effflux MFS transporter [Gammaproteobacteria bacterium]